MTQSPARSLALSDFKAKKILTAFRNSSSLPVLVETTDGTKCVVKWKGSGDGPLASAVDWICLHLARAVGIPVPNAFRITIGPDVQFDKRDDEILDLVSGSVGLNLATEHIEDSSPYTSTLASSVQPALRKLIYHFDVLLFNIDRTDHNPNMMFSHGKLFCIDCSAAMSVKMLLSGESYSELGLLSLLRRHPFYIQKSSDDYVPVPSADTVKEIVESTPDEWMPDSGNSSREKLYLGILQTFNDSRSILDHRLSLLDNLTLETSEERLKRLRGNRQAFEDRWGKL